eukprot:scaffold82464_cov66-Phaeocystis_antarctica.AAC.5
MRASWNAIGGRISSLSRGAASPLKNESTRERSEFLRALASVVLREESSLPRRLDLPVRRRAAPRMIERGLTILPRPFEARSEPLSRSLTELSSSIPRPLTWTLPSNPSASASGNGSCATALVWLSSDDGTAAVYRCALPSRAAQHNLLSIIRPRGANVALDCPPRAVGRA